MDRILRLIREVPWWGHLAVVALVVGVCVRLATTRNLQIGSVVPIYLNAAVRWQVEADLYDSALPLDHYRNPPIVAAFFVPFSHLPPKVAEIGWRMLNLVAFLLGFVAFLQQFHPWLTRLQLGFACCSVSFLILPSFNNGQMNLLMAACCVWAITLAERREWWLAAGWLTLAILLKTYPIALAMLLALVYPPLIGRMLVCFAVGFGLPFLLGPPGYVWRMHERYVEYTQFVQSHRHLIRRVYWDWSIIPTAWLGMTVPTMVTKIVSVVAGLACAIRVWYQPTPIVLLLMGTMWMTLFGPATEASTYTLTAPAVSVLLVTAIWQRSPVLFVLTWLAYGMHLQPILRGLFPTSEFLRGSTTQAIGTILLLIRMRFESPTLELVSRRSLVVRRKGFLLDRLRRQAPQ
jgi:hypothetical protein